MKEKDPSKLEEDEFQDEIEPFAKVSKFSDAVTALKVREDGGVILTGDKLGEIQLIELQNRMALRVYKD